MAPAQPLMDVKLECESHYATFEPNKESKSILANSDAKDLKGLDYVLLNIQAETSKGLEDIEVDIINTSNGEKRLAEADDPDATDYSSSFGDTESDNERCSALSEAEVESQYLGDDGFGSSYDEFSNMFQTRKKRLTNHWGNFIRPLRWRCKWAELKIKEFQSQARHYDRELVKCDQNRHSGHDQSMVEVFGSKSLPFHSQMYQRKSMKRRSRKRVEDTADIASYFSHHNLFSYPESKRTNADGHSATDDFVSTANMNQKADVKKIDNNNDPLTFEMRDSDNFTEQVLRKIDAVHSQVQKLKSRIDEVMSKHAAKFSSTENLSLLVPFDAQTSSAPSPTFSAGNPETTSVGAIYNQTQNICDYDLADLVLPESAISSYGEAIHIPDIIESTVGLLSAADVTFHHAEIGDSCEDILDNILVQNDGAGGEKPSFVSTSNQTIEKSHEPVKIGESADPSTNQAPKSNPAAKSSTSKEQSTLRSCLASDLSFPKNKRKRGERRAGPSSWSKKGSGEPDSQ